MHLKLFIGAMLAFMTVSHGRVVDSAENNPNIKHMIKKSFEPMLDAILADSNGGDIDDESGKTSITKTIPAILKKFISDFVPTILKYIMEAVSTIAEKYKQVPASIRDFAEHSLYRFMI